MNIMTVLQKIDALMKDRRFPEAGELAALVTSEHPANPEGWRRLGHVQETAGDFPGMLKSFAKVRELSEDDKMASLKIAQALILQSEPAAALSELDALSARAGADSYLLQQIGQLYTHLSAFQAAYDAFARAAKAAPKDAQALYNLATAATALGQMAEAVGLYDRVIALKPNDYDAYYNRATLRKWTANNNHIAHMEGLLKAGIPDRKGAVQLFYALAKEYEDLGEPGPAFAHLQRGANLRASMMAYHVGMDTRAMDGIRQAFDAEFFDGLPEASDAPGPVFIVGLPRTGTTLVDRILSSHSDVESLGEIHDLAQAVTRLSGDASNKDDLIRKSRRLDFDTLGEAYQASARQRGASAPFLVDKTPANFLYLGLIARAMPNARIIHLTRHPMDACFAIYKTLFRLGYPYSYRLEDLAAYYSAYRQLMAHWHTMMPGRILDVAYEDLVQDLEGQTRALLGFCRLEWQAACLSFHLNKSPSATASAAQVRQPIYAGSVGRWCTYAEQLKPLEEALASHGVSV